MPQGWTYLLTITHMVPSCGESLSNLEEAAVNLFYLTHSAVLRQFFTGLRKQLESSFHN
jgi:hypothetical protein